MNHHSLTRVAPQRGATRWLPLAALVGALALAAPGTLEAASPNFLYTFNVAGTLVETGSMGDSSSPYWWLNSGAYMPIRDGVGGTVHGALPATDPWRVLYNKNNPLDTGNGYYPQNLFRLVSKWSWDSSATSMSFIVDRNTMTDTSNRDGYSGVLLFAHYVDGSNLYYAGIRDDGEAVIKKKIGGKYYTLASAKVFSGTYNRTSNPSLIPLQQWMGIKFVTKNNADGSVSLELLLDRENDGTYTSVTSVKDSGTGGKALLSGHAGIRTDYKDVRFDNFRVVNL